jgi:diamine N-acetyltransferase
MVEFKKITERNYEECLKLKVFENQNNFVASNVYSLAQAWVFNDYAYPFAIYADDVMVGFIMMGYDKDKGIYDIWRLMIDMRYQGRGYGRAALLMGIRYLEENRNAREIFLSYEPENTVAEKLYESAGFRKTGDIEGGEIVMRYISGSVDGD